MVITPARKKVTLQSATPARVAPRAAGAHCDIRRADLPARRASFDVAPLAPGWPQTAELSDFIATPPVPRSHAPRGNAVFDALRRFRFARRSHGGQHPKIRGSPSWDCAATQSVEDGIPTEDRGNEVSPLCRSSGGIDEVLKRATPKCASEGPLRFPSLRVGLVCASVRFFLAGVIPRCVGSQHAMLVWRIRPGNQMLGRPCRFNRPRTHGPHEPDERRVRQDPYAGESGATPWEGCESEIRCRHPRDSGLWSSASFANGGRLQSFRKGRRCCRSSQCC